ncbi:hypothetical protein [Elizabethkingia anophelis]
MNRVNKNTIGIPIDNDTIWNILPFTRLLPDTTAIGEGANDA